MRDFVPLLPLVTRKFTCHHHGICTISNRAFHCINPLSFVNEKGVKVSELVAKSKDVLRCLGRKNDYIKLYLPEEAQFPSLSKTAVIEISNPDARNAFSGKMMAELADVVDELEKEEIQSKVTCVVLRGKSRWFCAGADLLVAKEQLSSREGGVAMGALMTDTLTRFRRLPLVSVAAIEGGAIGGGAELATACDFRLMDETAFIQFVQSRMGVSPGWGGGVRLVKIVGRQIALRLLGTAERLDAQKAQALGLIDTTFHQEKISIEQACMDFLHPFDQVVAEVLHGAKKVVTCADDVSLDRILAYEHDVFSTLWGGPANLKALETSLNKKKKK